MAKVFHTFSWKNTKKYISRYHNYLQLWSDLGLQYLLVHVCPNILDKIGTLPIMSANL